MEKYSKKTSPRYVTESTFEKHMRSIAKSFAAQAETLVSHGQVLQTILKELVAMREDSKYNRNTLLSFVGNISSHDRKINNLTVRVEKLEKI